LAGFEAANLGSYDKHPNHYTKKATVSSYAGFMLRIVLELKFKGNRLVGWPRRWFCQLQEDEGESWQEIIKKKIGDFLSLIPHKISQR
jgi:hypothetical protein